MFISTLIHVFNKTEQELHTNQCLESFNSQRKCTFQDKIKISIQAIPINLFLMVEYKCKSICGRQLGEKKKKIKKILFLKKYKKILKICHCSKIKFLSRKELSAISFEHNPLTRHSKFHQNQWVLKVAYFSQPSYFPLI